MKASTAAVAALLALATLGLAPGKSAAAPSEPSVQLAQIIKFDLFNRRGFPLRTCEFRCQEERNRCDDQAQTRDQRRDCRLNYQICSDDCNIYTPSR